MAREISMNGRKKIESIQKEFTEKFNYLTLIFLDEDMKSIDVSRSLAEVRTAKGPDISIMASLKVNTLEQRFMDSFGITVEIAYSKDGKVMHTKDSVNKTLNELNQWCEKTGCDMFLFKKALTRNTLLSTQEKLFNAIKESFSDAEAKKINKDNFLDIHLQSIHPKRGTHLFFNTAKSEIKLGFYVRDESFISLVVESASNIEQYSQGLRISGNPTFSNVEDAIEAAMGFIGGIMRENSAGFVLNVNPSIASYVSAFDENPDPICDLLDSLGTDEGKMSVYKVDFEILSNLEPGDIPETDDLEFVGEAEINDWEALAEIIGKEEAEANKKEYSNDDLTESSKIIFLYCNDEYVYSFLNPGEAEDESDFNEKEEKYIVEKIKDEDEGTEKTTKKLIDLVDTLISNFDPTPININDVFPLRWESNISIEDYDFSENYLDLDHDYERSNENYLKSVGSAIEINKNKDGSYEFWDGIFMIETHTWCSKLNTSTDFPSFSLINKRLINFIKLKDFLVKTYR